MAAERRNTKQRALAYLAARHPRVSRRHAFASKFYPRDESWTRTPVWWLDLRLARVQDPTCEAVYLLCESEGGDQFEILGIPTAYLLETQGLLCVVDNQKIRLHLSARPEDRFTDLRGAGQVKFAQFLLDEAGCQDATA